WTQSLSLRAVVRRRTIVALNRVPTELETRPKAQDPQWLWLSCLVHPTMIAGDACFREFVTQSRSDQHHECVLNRIAARDKREGTSRLRAPRRKRAPPQAAARRLGLSSASANNRGTGVRRAPFRADRHGRRS